MSYRCEPCKMFFTGIIPYNTHIVSANHRKKAQLHEQETNFQEATPSDVDPSIVKREYGDYQCTVCHITLNGLQQVRAHAAGRKHLTMARKSSLFSNPTAVASNISDLPLNLTNASVYSGSELSFKFRGIEIENVMSDVKIFNVDDPIVF